MKRSIIILSAVLSIVAACSGANSWTFSKEYSDGADTIIITLDDESNGTLILNGSMFNEDNPSDYTTYDITCKITKQ